MKQIPLWMLGLFLCLSAGLIVIGAIEVGEVGPLPVALGILWALFTLASLPRAFAD